MAEKTNNSDSKEGTCSICCEKSKFKLCEDIEKELIMNLKPQTQNKQDLPDSKNLSEKEHFVYKEIVITVDETTPKKVKKTNSHPEMQILKEFVAEQLQNIIKIVKGFEKSLSFYKNKYEEMINTLEEKLDCIEKLEKQNSCLQHGFNVLSQRLDFVEQTCIHVKTEHNCIQLGQQLNVDFTTPPRLYNTDFQVRDHKMSGGVWLYNNRDTNSNVDSGLAASTEYFSTESPGKSTTLTGIQLAPGGERRKSTTEPAPKDTVDDLQRRLDNLRGFNL